MSATSPLLLVRVPMRGLFVAALAAAVLATSSPAAAAEPALNVPKATLDAAVRCVGPKLAGTKLTPVLLVAGTGASGDDIYWITKGMWDRFGHPLCYVNFPDQTTADIQVSAQYLVNAIRYEYGQARRKIAIFGISQGGLLPRWALTWWPSLRPMVDDVVAVAGTQHGSTTIATRYVATGCAPKPGCPPALWQQASGSRLISALDAYPDETPGATSWTTVRTTGDELVTPQSGAKPASSLKGASNILIQSVCGGRATSHLGALFDSVSYAAFVDAATHSGGAKTTRLPRSLCSHPFADGLREAPTLLVLSLTSGRLDSLLVPGVTDEPPVLPYALAR